VTNPRSEVPEILRNLPWSLWLFAAFWISLAGYWQWLVHSDGIFGEMWDTLPAFRELHSMSFADIGSELLRKYAHVHIIALPKLGFWIDFQLFGASGRFTRSATFVAMALCFVCAVTIAIRAYQRPVICTLLGLILFFNGCQTFVVNWESLLQYYLAIFFVLLAFLLYDYRPQKLVWPALCLLLAALSCGSSIAGIGGFAFMLLVRAWHGERLSPITTTGFTMFVLAMVWLLWPEPNTTLVLENPGSFFWNAPNLLLQYLAYPFSAWGDMRWLGTFVLLAVAAVAWNSVILRNGTTADFVLMTFFLLGVTIVLGRYPLMGIDGDVMRYYGFMTPLWYFLLLRLFLVLRLLRLPEQWFGVLVVPFCLLVILAGLAAVVVTANLGQKMELARIVAINGNVHHLASQRLDALRGLSASLENSRDYLRDHSMDIYYQPVLQVQASDRQCRAKLLRQSNTTKGSFTDYFLQEDAANPLPLSAMYLADHGGRVQYYGTAFAASTHLEGWGITMKSVRPADWPLLLPVSWLPREHRLLYLHLPRQVPLDSLQVWATDRRADWCHLIIER
jgi:hypothetical protein